jgi:hypothetical protein
VAPVGPGFVDLVESCCLLRILEAWAELRSLLHDEARLESIAARGVAGPQATLEALRFASSGNAYVVRDFEVEPLGEEAALVRASISYSDRDVTVMTPVESLVSGCDGLIWRWRIVSSRAEAERILKDEGPELGL